MTRGVDQLHLCTWLERWFRRYRALLVCLNGFLVYIHLRHQIKFKETAAVKKYNH